MMVTTEQDDVSGRRDLLAVGAMIALATLALFLLGVAVGVMLGWAERGAISPKAIGALVTGLVLGGLAAWQALRLYRKQAGGMVSRRTRNSRNVLMICVLVGMVGGVALSMGGIGNDGMAALSNGPIAPWSAAVMIAIWAVLTPILSVIWWRNIDEHEKAAYSASALLALNLYIIATPTWWLLWRAGMAGPVEPMLVFVAVIAAWGIGWMKGRYL